MTNQIVASEAQNVDKIIPLDHFQQISECNDDADGGEWQVADS